MDWIQIHLALNHLPVVGVPLLVLWLGLGWWRKSEEVMRLALWLLVVLSVAAIAIKFTGDFAAAQSAARLAPVKPLVAAHEQTGDQVTTAVFVLGLAVAGSLFMARGGRRFRGWALALILALGMITSLLYVRTAHSGGRISHPELRP